MTLEEYILTVQDNNGEYIITIAEYYEKYVKPLDTRFQNRSLHLSSTVICPFKDHGDRDPSFGLMNHKFSKKGVKIYHCFGCNTSGTVIRLHQRIQREYHGIELTERESALDLCRLFGVTVKKFEDEADYGDETGYAKRYKKTIEALDTYTLQEYASDLLEARIHEYSLQDKMRKVNSANVKLIATKKQIFD